MDNKKIGKFLRDLRREQNLTQEELGEKLGATNKTISRWETGTYMPPADILLQMSKLYNVSVNEILSGERLATADYQPKAEENIVSSLNKSTTEQKRGIKIAIICGAIILALVIVSAVLLSSYLNKPDPYYTVTFDSTGGSEVEQCKVIADKNNPSRIMEPSCPYKSGYSFAGWYTVSNLQKPWNFATDVVTQSMTLYAKWEEATDSLLYRMDYDNDGNLVYIVIGSASNSSVRNIVIPSVYLGKPVIGINESAFKNSGMLSIVIPSSIQVIGDNAFEGCSYLQQIVLPDSVTTIGNNAFKSCQQLQRITIPDNVSIIGKNAFERCILLGDVVVGSNVKSIGDDAFLDCVNLVEVYNKSQLAITVGSNEFGRVAQYALNVYTSLSGESRILTVDDFLFYIGEQTCILVRYCGDKTDITLPDGPNNATYDIRDSAFANSYLTSVTINGMVNKVGSQAFKRCGRLVSVKIEEGVKKLGYGVFEDCSALKQVLLPDSLTEIGAQAFYWCKSLESIDIPDGVTEIGDGAFNGCLNLSYVHLPSKLEALFAATFYYCEKLESIVIPSGLKTIHLDAFSRSGLKHITLPQSLAKCNGYMFANCNDLESISIEEGNVDFYVVDNCLIYKDTVVAGCKNSIIPTDDSVTRIGEYAFVGRKGLTKIDIPANITNIAYGAFYGCIDVEQIIVSEDNPVYHSDGNCIIETATKMLMFMCKNSVIPRDGSVETIAKDVLVSSFKNGDTITVPNTVKSIRLDAFWGILSQINILYEGTMEQWRNVKVITNSGSFEYETNKWLLNVDAVCCTDGTVRDLSISASTYA